jgi:hypothetical protein
MVASTLPFSGTATREVTSGADNLVLFGEMLEVASECNIRCEETLGHEDAFMVELAHDQISSLCQRFVKTQQRLREAGIAIAPAGVAFTKQGRTRLFHNTTGSQDRRSNHGCYRAGTRALIATGKPSPARSMVT